MSLNVRTARALARSNIALAKYWGKSDVVLNLPAVPSISLTLDGLTSDTEVCFDPSLSRDEVQLDGKAANAREQRRVVELLDRVRQAADCSWRARVTSTNNFPTAAGLASSASGFAALAGAAVAALELDWNAEALSRLARQSSASAARSVFGGFVELPAGVPGHAELAAQPLAAQDHWDLRMVIGVVDEGRKLVGSSAGMEHSKRTSPFYGAWLEHAPQLAAQVRRGVEERDLERLGAAMEQSTLAFHACALAASPAVLYWRSATLNALATVRDLRETHGIGVWSTMDAGPHVKALCRSEEAAVVEQALAATAGVVRVLVASPGAGLQIQRS